MTDKKSETPDIADRRQTALSTWENEGGSVPGVLQEPPPGPPLTDAELVQLRVRVIALENLVLSLLAEAPDRQLALAREMAAYISPRPGFTHHPLTLHAAARMIQLVERACHVGALTPSEMHHPFAPNPALDAN